MQWLIAFGISTIIYMILQSIDDHRCRKNGTPCATVQRKLVLFFFVLIVVFVATFFLSGGDQDGGVVASVRKKVIGGENATNHGGFESAKVNELHMLKNIREDIFVGSGPFTKTCV